jgi:hypothetical protein
MPARDGGARVEAYRRRQEESHMTVVWFVVWAVAQRSATPNT